MGNSRAACVLLGYIMYKYKWDLRSTMAFATSKGVVLQLRPSLLQQLHKLEQRMRSQGSIVMDIFGPQKPPHLSLEQELLRTTFA